MTVLAMFAIVATFALFARASGAWGPRPVEDARERLRGGAWALLAFGFALSILAKGWVFGPILWSGLVMTGAGTVFLAVNGIVARDRR